MLRVRAGQTYDNYGLITADLAGGKKASKAELDRQQRDLLQRTMDGVARAVHRFIGEDYDSPQGTEVKMEGQNTTHLV